MSEDRMKLQSDEFGSACFKRRGVRSRRSLTTTTRNGGTDSKTICRHSSKRRSATGGSSLTLGSAQSCRARRCCGEAAQRFRQYEKQHRAKVPLLESTIKNTSNEFDRSFLRSKITETIYKANANLEMAERIEAELQR